MLSQDLLLQLDVASRAVGSSAESAISEKLAELRLRAFFRCLPNTRVKSTALPAFLTEVLGHQPSADLLEAITRRPRAARLGDDTILDIEIRQNSRCAVCGRFLTKSAQPHIDHIMPVALGGRSEVSNYQLLCMTCNLGKGRLLSWIMGQPFFLESGNELGARLRYCVLAHSCGECSHSDCEITSRTGDLFAHPRVPPARGGRLIFDNLLVLCERHKRERDTLDQARIVAMLSGRRYGVPLMPPRRRS